jgi:hypothetical protein
MISGLLLCLPMVVVGGQWIEWAKNWKKQTTNFTVVHFLGCTA